MNWILALSSVGLVLWGVGVWAMCRARDEPRRLITVLRHEDRLLVGMMAKGETWMWVIDHDSIGLMGLWLCLQVRQSNLSLTADDAEVITQAAERYMTAERSVAEQLKSM